MNQQPLGALLVRRGLITEEQLAAALADQRATGAPLGQIVVSRGYAASAAVAQALATQHGGLLKTEYGFATGFDSGGPPKPFVPPPVTSDAVAESRVLTPVAKAAVELVPDEVAVAEPEPDREALRAEVSSATEREALRAEVSSATEEAEKLRADNERLTELRSNLEQRLASEAQRAASLERELAAANEQINSATEGGPLRDDDSRISELEAALAARDAAIDKWEAGIAERDGALEEFRVAAEEWKAALAGRDEALAELAAGRDDALTQLREAKGALATWEAAVHELTVAWDEAVAQARTAAADEAAVQNARISGLALERDKALEKLEAAEAAQSEVVELPALRDEVLALRQAAAAATARIDELCAERDDALAALHAARAEVADLGAARDAAPEGTVDRWATAQSHLVFFRGPEGYELQKRGGPPPEPGSIVLLEHGPHVVARVGEAPGPGPRIPCAYLVA